MMKNSWLVKKRYGVTLSLHSNWKGVIQSYLLKLKSSMHIFFTNSRNCTSTGVLQSKLQLAAPEVNLRDQFVVISNRYIDSVCYYTHMLDMCGCLLAVSTYMILIYNFTLTAWT